MRASAPTEKRAGQERPEGVFLAQYGVDISDDLNAMIKERLSWGRCEPPRRRRCISTSDDHGLPHPAEPGAASATAVPPAKGGRGNRRPESHGRHARGTAPAPKAPARILHHAARAGLQHHPAMPPLKCAHCCFSSDMFQQGSPVARRRRAGDRAGARGSGRWRSCSSSGRSLPARRHQMAEGHRPGRGAMAWRPPPPPSAYLGKERRSGRARVLAPLADAWDDRDPRSPTTTRHARLRQAGQPSATP